MKLSKFDIGAEIISILTKGMYPDPKDALREYIQNAVDAKSKNITVKIRNNAVTVQDDGIGMNHEILRKAIRVGISDKNPTKNVGFFGIGIYSAFHLCSKLTIYSRSTDDLPNRLEMDFCGMKELLDEQKSLRINGKLDGDSTTDLQTLLEKFISLTEPTELVSEEFPNKGTRIELSDITPAFYSEICDFAKVAEYLRDVIPLRFDRPNFSFAEEIENKITEKCVENNCNFELVNLKLQVNGTIEDLYKPYKDEDFGKNCKPQAPLIEEIKIDNKLVGIAWGCHNSEKKVIANKSLRGFLLRKQGFAIGKRENMIKHFPRGNTFFDRYMGEVIIISPDILPNASRNDIEYTNLRTLFFQSLGDIASKYDEFGNKFQEEGRAEEVLSEATKKLKEWLGANNINEINTEKLLNISRDVKNELKKVTDKKNKKLRQDIRDNASELEKELKHFEKAIHDKIDAVAKRKKISKHLQEIPFDIAQNLSKINIKTIDIKKYDSLIELLEDMEIEFSSDMRNVLNLVDEKFIQAVSQNRQNYYEILNDLKQSISNNQ